MVREVWSLKQIIHKTPETCRSVIYCKNTHLFPEFKPIANFRPSNMHFYSSLNNTVSHYSPYNRYFRLQSIVLVYGVVLSVFCNAKTMFFHFLMLPCMVPFDRFTSTSFLCCFMNILVVQSEHSLHLILYIFIFIKLWKSQFEAPYFCISLDLRCRIYHE